MTHYMKKLQNENSEACIPLPTSATAGSESLGTGLTGVVNLVIETTAMREVAVNRF